MTRRPPRAKGHLINRLFSTLLFGTMAAGLSACMTASDHRADLKADLRQQVRACYILPRAARADHSVILEVRLKRNGSLEGPPEVIVGQADSPVAKAAVRAIRECAPFTIPEKWASRYDAWKVLRVSFDPS